jgi:hypothetical protein
MRDLRSRTIQAHVYGCASIVCVLPTPEILQTDVLCRVIVGVILVAAIQTLEVLSVAVVIVGKSTGRTPLRGVPQVHLDSFDTLLSGFVFDVLVEATERPQMVPRRLWHVRTNVGRSSI